MGSCRSRDAIALAAIASRSRSAGGQALPARLVLLQHAAHDLVGARVQGGDRRGHVLGGHPAVEARQLGAQDALDPARLGLASREVALDQRLQVVHVVEAGGGDLAAARLDVARHGEVDQQQRPAAAHGHHLGERLALDHVVGGARGGDDDVGVGQLLGQLLEAHRMAAEALGEPDRAVVVAVGDEDRLDALGCQGAGGELCGLARADDQHAAVLELPERPLGELDRDRRDRERALGDAGLRCGPACRRPARCGRGG